QENEQNQGAAAIGVTNSHGGDSSCGCDYKTGKSSGGQQVDQSRSGSNENEASQTAASEASSEQPNVNNPVTVDSPWSSNGDVKQSNNAENNTPSLHNLFRPQENEQNQGAAAVGVTDNKGGDSSCGCDYKTGKSNGGQQVD